MTLELAVSFAALLAGICALVGTVLLARRRRRDLARLRSVGRRVDRLAARAAKQREHHRRLREAVGDLTTREASSAGHDTAKLQDAHRLATETARALEYLLIDVNELRRDLDAAGGEQK